MLLSRQVQGLPKSNFALRELVLRLQYEAAAAVQFRAPKSLPRRFDALQSFAEPSQPLRMVALPCQRHCQDGEAERPHSARPSRWKPLAQRQIDDRITEFAAQKQGRPAQYLRVQYQRDPQLPSQQFSGGEPSKHQFGLAAMYVEERGIARAPIRLGG